ncbi:MAG: c-type cytochrome [Bacteriovoracales bacterium]|nr:c-type cytochrome [Bacteriovoracales bacterium]
MKLETGMAYRSSTLIRWFAFISILFLFSVLAMFLDDYIRPWKGWQIKSLAVKREKLKKDIEAKLGKISPEKLAELENSFESAKDLVEERQESIRKLEGEINTISGQIHGAKLELSVYNGRVAELTFRWEHAHAHGDPRAPKLKKKLDHNRVLFAATKEKIKELEASKKGPLAKVSELKAELIAAEKEQQKLFGQVELLKGALAKTDISNPVWILRNAPFIDWLDPTIKVEQVVLDHITDDRYFRHVPKVDRCMTCHTFIDQKGFEDQPNPFKTHPNLDLMVGLASPHPMKSFGCTSCHGGEGHRINDFNAAAHTPQNLGQQKSWEKDYHWHAPHKVPEVMNRLQYTEAGCYKCHKGVEMIPMAHKYNRGKELIKDYGCYACHVIPEFEEKRKPGPPLNKLASKLEKNWVKNWIWNPFGFNSKSRMPSFFRQSNNSKPEFENKNIAEVNAMAEYLWDQSEEYRPFGRYKGGNVAKGKELISSVGCISCHQVEGIEASQKVGAKKAPYLTGTGSKVDPHWLVSWVQRPSHYAPETIMPSFRLTSREAQDVTAYLLSLKNDSFSAKTFAPLDKGVRDDLLLEYFMAFDTKGQARGKLAVLSDREKTLELGKRSLGKYGCYSCHSIGGFAPGRAPIGPNLSTEGSKPIHQFGFGHEKIPHERDTWIFHHLKNPRRWDKGQDKPFKDLSRMPMYYLSDDEAQAMTLTILGYTTHRVPEKGIKRLDANEAYAEKGLKHVAKYNCTSCHKIDGVGGDILAAYEDDENEGPPWLVDQGHRVHSDWLYHFLGNVYPIRPWLKVRMPSFKLTDREKNEITAYFQAKAHEHSFRPSPSAPVEWEPGERRAALKLFDALACASCHTTGFNRDDPMAPALQMTKRRLRSSWIEKWLANPQAILPHTTMPNFWEDGEAQEPDILGGDPKKQITALRKYLQEIGHDQIHGELNRSSTSR